MTPWSDLTGDGAAQRALHQTPLLARPEQAPVQTQGRAQAPSKAGGAPPDPPVRGSCPNRSPQMPGRPQRAARACQEPPSPPAPREGKHCTPWGCRATEAAGPRSDVTAEPSRSRRKSPRPRPAPAHSQRQLLLRRPRWQPVGSNTEARLQHHGPSTDPSPPLSCSQPAAAEPPPARDQERAGALPPARTRPARGVL
ncbi:hypothetical protein NDU88_002571 [Pleurodeles waltl]|uniref:Uncharacterized protein n=1 Tax=Pleurodeles waltl TaxID=8319 RepID=A0AAV7VD78_PLEWA|nr:hypothetical protein NDU88_002571 [Pleurodeles waltl]